MRLKTSVRPCQWVVFSCKELYFTSFTPNLMPPSALIRHHLLPRAAVAAGAAGAGASGVEEAARRRPLVILLDRSDLSSLYPVGALRPRRLISNHGRPDEGKH